MSFADIRRKVLANDAVTMLTCYDAGWASLLDGTVDMLLVGDSVANVCLGMESTRGVGMEAMVHHTKAVRAGARRSLVVADMPFGTYLQCSDALHAAARLMAEGGADAVKLEGGGEYLAETVRALTRAGIPVVAHVGLLPQTAGASTGFRVQGQDSSGGRAVVADAVSLASAGASAVVLEMVPDEVAAAATARLRAMGVATIGIGAGPGCSGQVLVLHDALGLTPDHARAPRFSRRFAQLAPVVQSAAEAFARAVRDGSFPSEAESKPMAPRARAALRKAWDEDEAFSAGLDWPVVERSAGAGGGSRAGPRDADPLPRQRFAVVGAGAMGQLIAERLAAAAAAGVASAAAASAARAVAGGGDAAAAPEPPLPVVLVPVRGGLAAAKPVLAAASKSGSGTGHPHEGRRGLHDVVFVAVRNSADQLAAAAGLADQLLRPWPPARGDLNGPSAGTPPVVVAIQNGMGAAESLKAALRGRAIVLDCVTTHGATIKGGSVTHSGGPANSTSLAPLLQGGAETGDKAVGQFSPEQELEAAGRAAAWLRRAGLGGDVLSPLSQASARLRKLSVTCSLVAVAATAGVTNGEAIAKEGRLRGVVRELAAELVPVVRAEARRLRLAASAQAAQLDDGASSGPDTLAWAADSLADEAVADAIMEAAVQVGSATSDNVCSLLASKRGGAAHELAATLGWACHTAEREGASTPRLSAAMASLAAAAEALA